MKLQKKINTDVLQYYYGYDVLFKKIICNTHNLNKKESLVCHHHTHSQVETVLTTTSKSNFY